MKNLKTERFLMAIEPTTRKELKRLSEQKNKSMSAVVRDLIQQAAAAPNTERLQTTR